jgi:Ca2+-binding RTX toxin-like protein
MKTRNPLTFGAIIICLIVAQLLLTSSARVPTVVDANGGAPQSAASTSEFRGVNWAAPDDNYSDGPVKPSGLESLDINKADKILQGFKDNLKANTVRLPINPPSIEDNGWWDFYTRVIDRASDKDMKVILSYWEVKGQKDGLIDNMNEYQSMWDEVVNRFRGDSNVYFEPMNEPYCYRGVGQDENCPDKDNAPKWTDVAADWLYRYRDRVLPGKVIISGTGYNSYLGDVGSDYRLKDCLLSLHIYTFGNWPHHTTEAEWLQELKNRLADKQIRAIVDEFGVPMTTGLDFNDFINGDKDIAFMKGVTDQIHAYNMGAVYWPGIRDGDNFRMENLDSNGSLSPTNESGFYRLRWAWDLVPPPPIQIKSRFSEKCADIENDSLENGAIFQQFKCSKNLLAQQQWLFKPTRIYDLYFIPRDYYQIISVNSGKCLEVNNWSTADKAKVDQWSCHGGKNQLWRLDRLDSTDYYQIVNVNTIGFLDSGKKCLDVSDWSTKEGAQIWQYSCNGNANQQWLLSNPPVTPQNAAINFSKTMHIWPGETIKFPVVIAANQPRATFATSWLGSDFVMSLTTPSGRVIGRNTNAPDVLHRLTSTSETYTVLTPEAGTWEVSLFGAVVEEGGEDVLFELTTDNQAPLPELAYLDGSTLVLNMGSAERRAARYIQTDEINEDFTVKQLSADSFSVTAFGLTQVYTGATTIQADGDDGNDTITLEASDVPFTAPATISGGTGDDQIHSGDGADTLAGGEGDDQISGGGGDDTITGDSGNDHIQGGDGDDQISGGGGSDTITGNAGDDHIQGGDDNDDLHGGDGNDTINGDAGDDHIDGDGGDDSLYGDDTLACEAEGSAPSASANVISPAPNLAGPYFVYLGLILNNTSSNQSPAVDPSGNDQITGGPGNDHLFGGGLDDTLSGDDGNDEICGNSGRDTMSGNAGDDLMHGGAGDDHMEGNDGADTMRGDDGNDEMYGQAGPDRMYGGAGDDRMDGGTGDDYMEGNDGADTMHGDDDNDEMYGQAGPDRMYGGAGDDRMDGGAGDDYMEGNDGADTMHGGTESDEMHGQAGPDTMYGDADRDTMYGNAGDDAMHGGPGDDYMEGNQNADTMYGDEGQDDMIGGTSTASVPDGQDTIYGGAGHDVMTGDNASITRPVDGNQWITNTFSPDTVDVVRRTIELFDVATTISTPTPGAYDSDRMYGEDGFDIMYGQGGDDTMSGGASADSMEGNAGGDTMAGDAGQDDMIGGTGRINNDPPQGVNGRLDSADTIYGESNTSEGLTDGDGADVILGDNAIITRPLDQNSAWQINNANGAAIRVITLLDIETVTNTVDPTVHGNDTLWGNDNDDTMYGQAGEDELHGGAGDDYIEGNAASDTIYGDSGDDDMIGGSGPSTSNDPATFLPGRVDASTRARTIPLGTNPAVSVPLGDTMYGGKGSDVMLGDNGTITRPVDKNGRWSTLTYLLFTSTDGGAAPRHTTSGTNTRIDRNVSLVDMMPGVTAGSDLMYGGAGDDDLYGQLDDTNGPIQPAIGDELLGEEGEDAMVGDLGVVNNRVIAGDTQTIRPPEPFIDDDIFVHGTLFRYVTLWQAQIGGNDRMLGGPDGDWMHGGAGSDLMNGNSGNDRLFGDNGADVMWGGPHHDHLWGGSGDDYLDIKPRPATISGNGNNDRGRPRTIPADTLEWFFYGEKDNFQNIDYIYGGWDQDAMQADVADTGPVPGDRLIDWVGAYNVYYLCPGLYGEYVITRDHSPHIVSFLQSLAAGDGAANTASGGSSGFNEIAIVFSKDIQQNSHPPHPDNPGHFTCATP